MKRLIAVIALSLPLLFGCTVQWETNLGCTHTKDLSGEMGAEAAQRLLVNARSGDLTIRGQEGLTEVRVGARACASNRNLLEQMDLKVSQSGDAVQVNVIYPDRLVNESAWMDLTIDAPAALVARVDGGSGNTHIVDLAGLDLDKGSGDVEILRINGDLKLVTGSGNFRLEEVTGKTTLDSGSGDLVMRKLQGAVRVADKGSGRFEASELGGSLTIRNLNSGDLVLQSVAGDVQIDDKGSGHFLIRDVGKSLTMGTVGSGDLVIEGIGGPVTVADKSSGQFEAAGVKGSVELGSIGSGSMTLKEIAGDVRVKDKSSGDLEIDGVEGSVLLGDIGSGQADIRHVKGDLVVEAKSSGDINHSGVVGRIDLPPQ